MLYRLSALLTALLAASQLAAADQLPKQVLGVWMSMDGEKNTCTRRDWHGDDSDFTMLLIEPTKMSGHEWGCLLSTAQSSANGVLAQLKCGGEGNDWGEAQKMTIYTTEQNRYLVLTTKTSKMTEQQGQQNPPVPTDRREKTEVYKYCK